MDYENELGFVPHNYACFLLFEEGAFTCDPYSQVSEGRDPWTVRSRVSILNLSFRPNGMWIPALGMNQHVSSDDPIICNCNATKCKWENMANPDADAESVRVDCTRGYEWIKLPIGPGSKYFGKIVDFTTGKSGGVIATSAIGSVTIL